MKFWIQFRGQHLLADCADSRYELGTTFFKSDVLSKYRSKPSKYIITDTFIRSTEEGWILQSCYVNDDNIVYAYLCDLSLLPEEEQYYWQVFNIKKEDGKANLKAINESLYCVFESWEKEDLFQILKKLQSIEITSAGKNFSLWKSKEDLRQMINELSLPIDEEYKQYRDDFLLPLSRLVIEGFLPKSLKECAITLGISLDNKGREEGSLITLGKILKKISKHDCEYIVNTLRELHREKSSRSSHGGKDIEKEMIQKAKEIIHDVTNALISVHDIILNHNERIPENTSFDLNL